VCYTPSAWKGQVPKSVHHARILAALSYEEQSRIPKLPTSKLHNVLDAVALGLFHVGRVKRGGVRPKTHAV
jgi:hypothetical protein